MAQRGFAQLLQKDSVTEPYRQVSILDNPFYTHRKYMNWFSQYAKIYLKWITLLKET